MMSISAMATLSTSSPSLLHPFNKGLLSSSLCRVKSTHGVCIHLGIPKTQTCNMGTTCMHDRLVAVVCGAQGRTNCSTRLMRRKNETQLGRSFQAHVMAMAASTVILLSSQPVQAGLLSGSSGLESVPRPEIPQIDFLRRIQEENQKKYEENDAKFKSSSLLQELLKRSRANAERNKQEIQDKYCERGAEWGVGDCSTVGMSKEEREAFMEMLRERRAPK